MPHEIDMTKLAEQFVNWMADRRILLIVLLAAALLVLWLSNALPLRAIEKTRHKPYGVQARPDKFVVKQLVIVRILCVSFMGLGVGVFFLTLPDHLTRTRPT